MPRSIRLDSDLESRLAQAAEQQGVTLSTVIREAVRRHCNEILSRSLLDDLREGIGVVEIGGDNSSRTGEAFKRRLRERSG